MIVLKTFIMTNFQLFFFIESEPECSVTEFVDHRIRVGCSVTYSGKWSPKMEWRHHIAGTAFADGILFYNGINTDHHANKTHVISTLNAFVLHSVQDAFTISCKTFFDTWKTAISKFSASNVPDFVYIWNSTVFGQKKSTFEPTVEADERFENITCPYHADVNTQTSKQESENECKHKMQNIFYKLRYKTCNLVLNDSLRGRTFPEAV